MASSLQIPCPLSRGARAAVALEWGELQTTEGRKAATEKAEEDESWPTYMKEHTTQYNDSFELILYSFDLSVRSVLQLTLYVK